MSRENGFENVVSDLTYVSTKLLLEKSAKTKKTKTKKKHLQSSDSGDKTSSSGRFLRPHFQNSFPPQFLFF